MLSVWPWLSLLTCSREGVGATWLLSYGRGRIDFSLGWSIWLLVPKPTHFYSLYPKSHSPIKKKVDYVKLFPPLVMICSCRFHFTSSFGFCSCFIGWNLHYYSTTIGWEMLCFMLILIWYQGNDKWLDELLISNTFIQAYQQRLQTSWMWICSTESQGFQWWSCENCGYFRWVDFCSHWNS